MKRIIGIVVLALFFVGALTALPMVTSTRAENPRIAEERAEHPRIVKAIKALEEAVSYMRRAPHDFGGHKAEAIEASENAIRQLKLALKYRAKEDKLHSQK
jgi:hypothetical protein